MAAVRLSEYRACLKQRLDADLEAQVGEWFAEMPHAQRAWLSSIVAEGKRLRGCLVCLVAEALGARLERALPAAFAIEIVQAASLVHDDLVDGDTRRRGRAAAWTWLTPRHAVLLADVMFATALERMAALGAREADTLAQAIAAMARGALLEVVGERAPYPTVIRWKTGSLFGAAARLGALAAGAAPGQLRAAYDYGVRTGEAYQMADDMVDAGAPASLRDAIAVLVERAVTELEAFPDNHFTSLLREVPADFAASMAPA